MFYRVKDEDLNSINITSSNSTLDFLIYEPKLYLVGENRPFKIEIIQIIINA